MCPTLTLSNLILDRPLAVIDLETTGLDPSADRVVEVAVLTLLPHGKSELFHRRVNPGVPIPAGAAAVHGLSDADVAGAPPFAAVAPELFATLHGCDLAGFGIGTFDLPLLAAEFARVGLPFRVAGRRFVDALALYRRLYPRDLAPRCASTWAATTRARTPRPRTRGPQRKYSTGRSRGTACPPRPPNCTRRSSRWTSPPASAAAIRERPYSRSGSTRAGRSPRSPRATPAT